MSAGRGRERHGEPPDEQAVRVDAEDLADGDRDVRGATTEEYTLTPPASVVREETTMREAPREAPHAGQRAARPTPASRPVPAGGTREVDIPETYALDRDRVRWPAVFAGLLTALTMLITLGVLGLAVGLTSVDAGAAVAQRGVPSGLGLGSGLWAGLSAILAFLLGGWVAGRTAAVFGKGWGALNGMLVFLLAVPLTLWLAGSGIGALLGSFGGFAQSLNIDPQQVQQGAQQQAQEAQQNAQQVTPEQASEAARNARNAAWSTLLGLGLGTAAATIGGLLGTRSHLDVDRGEVAQARESIVR
jgi:hypothetical protein